MCEIFSLQHEQQEQKGMCAKWRSEIFALISYGNQPLEIDYIVIFSAPWLDDQICLANIRDRLMRRKKTWTHSFHRMNFQRYQHFFTSCRAMDLNGPRSNVEGALVLFVGSRRKKKEFTQMKSPSAFEHARRSTIYIMTISLFKRHIPRSTLAKHEIHGPVRTFPGRSTGTSWTHLCSPDRGRETQNAWYLMTAPRFAVAPCHPASQRSPLPTLLCVAPLLCREFIKGFGKK